MARRRPAGYPEACCCCLARSLCRNRTRGKMLTRVARVAVKNARELTTSRACWSVGGSGGHASRAPPRAVAAAQSGGAGERQEWVMRQGRDVHGKLRRGSSAKRRAFPARASFSGGDASLDFLRAHPGPRAGPRASAHPTPL